MNSITSVPNLGLVQAASTNETLFSYSPTGKVAKASVRGEYVIGKSFSVRAIGKATGGAAAHLTLRLYVNDELLASSGSLSFDSATGNFLLKAECVIDPEGVLFGAYSGVANGTVISHASLSPIANPVEITTELHFSVSFQWDTEGNSAQLTALSIEEL